MNILYIGMLFAVCLEDKYYR